METVVSLSNVTKKINNKTIIDSISFDVYAGEIFGFLGPNGAGKTTTIRMLVGLMKITSGDIHIGGHSVKTNFEDAVKHIGAIVENPEMYKFMSGYDNLKHYARMTGGVSSERIAEIVELVGLTQRIKEKVKTYSLGMRQRLGLAQALLHRPKVLILDEPTNGLDPAGIREIRDYLKKLAREENMAVIVSSHLLSEMEMMCDRIGIIQNGKMIDVQNVREIMQEDKQSYVINAKPLQKAYEVLKKSFSEEDVIVSQQSIHIKGSKAEIPNVINKLVENEIEIYQVSPISKSLEDKFLEITGDKGGVA
ncbi:ABC transporter ATP-binding protein [Peribacillus cavernae]|uniref:ABC transporter ATP-binding protein n=1 Tax=Peribacillus cavernae TaxID=1674310 RepID=A0A433HWJ7_9BACI|nr:ABC transporter ATP-binding protein [Peribacillus cavernae]MDQ0218191.1 ABC-2 type transport system ATP-binding protein [Peribacillus cavernae]RUQ32666.1 ABC transporter ATP-binding protein [Peribacillus cavernae]